MTGLLLLFAFVLALGSTILTWMGVIAAPLTQVWVVFFVIWALIVLFNLLRRSFRDGW